MSFRANKVSRGIHNKKTNNKTNNKQLTINNLNQTKMKKLFFIAAIASAALVSCTKNEVAPIAQDQEITFATPVVGNLTKVAGEIGTNYDKNEKFVVFGWYCEEDSFNPANASVYMNAVTVQHNGDINASVDAGDQGAWEPVTTFYWPKNGKLTFSAYSPLDATSHCTAVDCDKTTGLHLTDFTVQLDPAYQYDLLYSDRAYNKTTSNGEMNAMYDGVDSQFRHALSSIHVNVKNDKTYPAGTITVNKIELQNVYCTADFKENLTSGTESESATSSAWEAFDNEQTVVLGQTNQEVVYDKAKYGTTALLIPQTFAHSTKTVSLYVEYTIKNEDGSVLPQKATFKLNEYTGTIGGVDAGLLTQWTKGYRYTYNLTFGLTEVYFAPSVETWKDVDVVFPAI